MFPFGFVPPSPRPPLQGEPAGHRRGGWLAPALLATCLIGHASAEPPPTAARGPAGEQAGKSERTTQIDFVRDVRPLFRQHCYGCHGSEEQESGFRLDVRSAAFEGGYGYGKVLVAGKPQESLLLKMVSGDADYPQMPPDQPLAPSDVRTLRRWVEQGALWPADGDDATLQDRSDHWAFQPLASPALPSEDRPAAHGAVQGTNPPVGNAGPSGNVIDHFVRRKLHAVDLDFAPPADRITWLRRVSLDLVGVPPTPQQIDGFLADRSPIAFERVVDRLLSSPRYGERWAQHWLDVVRYADTHGFEVNTPRPNAWPYRDYVIEAFNRDTPYDQFIREQLAGDQFDRDAATGFLVTAAALLPGQIGKDGASKRLARQDELAEILINTSEAFLALSIGCARCHDHKTDAISHRDYYALQAYFSGVRYGERPLKTAQNRRRLDQAEAIRQAIDSVNEQLAAQSVPANAGANEISFPNRRARFVRFSIHHANEHPRLGLIEPCVDEFEIFGSSPETGNVALASDGTRVTASGSRQSANHRLEFIHDGRYGNRHSWMSDQAGRGWVMFELPRAVNINRIVWSRDREGKYRDRTATAFTLEVGMSPSALEVVAGLRPRQVERLRGRLRKKRRLQTSREALQRPQVVFGGRFEQPEPTHVLLRGDPEQPHTEVAPAVPAVFGQLATQPAVPAELPATASDRQRRRQLAEWIADPRHPLTARVMVNRIWQGHFGRGLVETSSDFGRAGSTPTHPRLLDQLAAEFIRSGWSIKHLHRLVVLSQTYRQSNRIDPAAQALDGQTRLLWRFPSRRLEAEAIRDSMLAVAGNLNSAMGGPGFDFFQRRGGLSGFPPVETFRGEGLKRMIYAHKIRMERSPVFGAFDCPDAGQTTPRRRQSTTPIQALNLFNSQFTLDQSRVLAERVRREAEANRSARVAYLFRLTLGRRPTAAESAEIEPVVAEHGLELLARVIFNSNEFLFLP